MNYTREDSIKDIEWLYEYRNEFTTQFLIQVAEEIMRWQLFIPEDKMFIEK